MVTQAEEDLAAGGEPRVAFTGKCTVPHPTAIHASVISEEPKMTHYTEFVSAEEAAHLIELASNRWIRSTVTRGKASTLLNHKVADMAPAAEGQVEGDPRESGVPCQLPGPAEGEDCGAAECGAADCGSDADGEAGGACEKGPVEVKAEVCTSSSVRLAYEESAVVERVLARAAVVSGWPLENMEQLVLVRYLPGQHFGRHHDGGMRPATCFVYLNDVPEGGETRFPALGLQVRPKMGTAVVWNNTHADSKEADRRMDHEGRPPAEGHEKYGLNCFVNYAKQRDCSNIKLVHLKS